MNVTTAPAELVASALRFERPASTGAVLSETVMVNEAVARFPDESVAVHVTVVVPRGKVLLGENRRDAIGEATRQRRRQHRPVRVAGGVDPPRIDAECPPQLIQHGRAHSVPMTS